MLYVLCFCDKIIQNDTSDLRAWFGLNRTHGTVVVSNLPSFLVKGPNTDGGLQTSPPGTTANQEVKRGPRKSSAVIPLKPGGQITEPY